jgi:hypothetical protein
MLQYGMLWYAMVFCSGSPTVRCKCDVHLIWWPTTFFHVIVVLIPILRVEFWSLANIPTKSEILKKYGYLWPIVTWADVDVCVMAFHHWHHGPHWFHWESTQSSGWSGNCMLRYGYGTVVFQSIDQQKRIKHGGQRASILRWSILWVFLYPISAPCSSVGIWWFWIPMELEVSPI